MPVLSLSDERQQRLERLMWLSIATAVATIGLKVAAWLITGSVGLLSDAAESVVNLVAAGFGLAAVRWAAQPPDEEHAYGHDKANYLAAGVEGALILLAAVTIAVAAGQRLLDPQALDAVGAGLLVSVLASGLNLVMARALIAQGRAQHSLVLEADGRHLMTDVWTSVGVIAGVGLVAVTGVEVLDPIVALAVAVNIVIAGVALMRRSTGGLMDRALRPDEIATVNEVLDRFACEEVQFHALRTRRAGPRAFVSVHVLVPGAWTVQRGHDLVERVEEDLRDAFVQATVFTHLEPLEDPLSFEDTQLDRGRVGRPPGA